MPSLVRRTLLTPFWLAQVLAQEKFFARNPVIGSRWRNEHGLHTTRAAVAHRLATRRRHRLARRIGAAGRECPARDGYIVQRDFLPARLFSGLSAQIPAVRAAAPGGGGGGTVPRPPSLAP